MAQEVSFHGRGIGGREQKITNPQKKPEKKGSPDQIIPPPT